MAGVRRQCYGPELAELVADRLVAGHQLAVPHRDYCGMGLEHRGGTFYYGEVWDGQLHGWNTHENRAATLVPFATRAVFVAWLSTQSDYSLSRRELPDSFYRDNQTISRQRLHELVGRDITPTGA